MKRTGFVIALVGIVIGFIPTFFYALAAFDAVDYGLGTAKTMAVLGLLSGVVVLIGYVVIIATLGKQAAPPNYGQPYGQPYAGQPAQYPQPGYQQPGQQPGQHPQPGYQQRGY